MLPFKYLRIKAKYTESGIAEAAGLSRLSLRSMEANKGNPTLRSLASLAECLNRSMEMVLVPYDAYDSDVSTVAISMKIERDGFTSWPLHLMELVDRYRATANGALLLLPPVKSLDIRIKALMSSMVLSLCKETGQEPPRWSLQSYYLPHPWFVAETESLKALAIRDSPWAFRKNNIFVLDNFMARA